MSAGLDQRLTVDQLLTLRLVGDAELSADGRRVAGTVAASTAARGELPPSRVWVGEVDGVVRAVSDGPGRDLHPRFSPDGTRLAFASDHGGDGRMTLYLLALGAAGDPLVADAAAVAAVPGSVERLCWSRDGEELLVLAVGDASTADASGASAAAPAGAWRRLYRVALASGATEEVGPAGLGVWEVDWNGSGEAVAIVSDGAEENDWYAARVALLDLDARRERTLHVPERQLQSPTISSDGRRIAFVEGLASDRGELAGTATVIAVDAPDAVVRRAPEHDLAGLRWLDDGSLLGVGPVGLETHCLRIAPDGTVAVLWRGPATLGRMSAAAVASSADGRRLLAAKAAPGEPPELALLDLDGPADGEWRPLTAVNAALADRAVPRAERFAWAARDGQQIEGILLHPPVTASPGAGPLPLLVCAHGGPANAWTFDYALGAYGLALVAAGAGYAVLLPNPRGSTGRGPAFVEAVLGDVGGEDFHDLLRGVEALVAAGTVDAARVAISGISYGGYLSAWAVARTDAFAAAIPYACVADWRSFARTTNIPAFAALYLGDDRLDGSDPQALDVARSPVARACGPLAPTLILHGADDPCAPADQSRELHAALTAAGAEAELVLYARGLHHWGEHEQLRDTLEHTLAWLDRHLTTDGGPA